MKLSEVALRAWLWFNVELRPWQRVLLGAMIGAMLVLWLTIYLAVTASS